MKEKEYFNYLKSKKVKQSKNELDEFYNGCLLTVGKLQITGQKALIQKLSLLTECVEKEKQLLDIGIDSYVYRDDIEEYIDKVAKNTVKIIELENYPRDIPDDIVDIISKTKNIFDKMYIVFTDYTGEVEKQVAKERREKDPILFGTFQKVLEVRQGNVSRVMNDKFYYLGDWEDEYCDLTMDKFLKKVGKDKLKKVGIPTNKEEIVERLNELDGKPPKKKKKKFLWIFKR